MKLQPHTVWLHMSAGCVNPRQQDKNTRLEYFFYFVTEFYAISANFQITHFSLSSDRRVVHPKRAEINQSRNFSNIQKIINNNKHKKNGFTRIVLDIRLMTRKDDAP